MWFKAMIRSLLLWKCALAFCLLCMPAHIEGNIPPTAFGNSKGALLQGAYGNVAVVPKAFVGLELLGQEEMYEAKALFDPAEEKEWIQNIAFEEETKASVPKVPKAQEVAALDVDELRSIKETLTFQSLKKVDIDPQTFDVKPLEDDDDPLFGTAVDFLTRGEIALLDELFAEEAAPGHYSHHIPKMLYIEKEELNPALDHKDRNLLKGTLLPTSGKPTLLVKASAFYIDLRPISNGEYAQFVRATKAAFPRHWNQGKIPEGQEEKPVVNVSYQDASRYAAWIGKRLPTQLEWTRAFKKGLVSEGTFKEWTATPASANSKLIQAGGTFQPRNENWFDHTTSFRTAVD